MRVLVVGYSHYCKEAEMDDEDVTVKVVQRVMFGEERKLFWSAIRNWFRFKTNPEFWGRVGFINYAPGPIGCEDEKFRDASDAELEGADKRLLNVMEKQQADVAFVFTSKGGADLKQRLAKYQPSISRLTLPDDKDVRADYVFEDVRLTANGRGYRIILAGHPQGAHRKTMATMVDAVLLGVGATA